MKLMINIIKSLNHQVFPITNKKAVNALHIMKSEKGKHRVAMKLTGIISMYFFVPFA